MIFEILLISTFGLTSSLLLTLLNNFIRSKIALEKYRKQLNGNVPFDDEDVGWFSNHMFKISMEKNCHRIHERHQKYGANIAAMFHECPGLLSCDLDFIKRAIIDDSNVNINRIAMQLPLKEYEKDCILFAENDQWRRIRKSFAPALKPRYFKTPNVLNSMETTIGKLIDAIEQRLNSSKHGEEQQIESNVYNLMHRFSLATVMSCFYKQTNIVNFNLDQNCHWTDMVDSGLSEMHNNQIIRLGLIVPAIRRIVDFIVFHFHPISLWRRDLFRFLKIQARDGLEARKQMEEMRKQNQSFSSDENSNEDKFLLKDGTEFKRTIMDYIVDQFHSGEISKDEYFNSSAFLFNAADKTVTDAIVHTLYQLALNENIQEKLRKSIQEQGIDCEYLDWVINESLRLQPPVPAGPSRSLSKPAKLSNGTLVVAGTVIVTSLYTIHRLPQYWGKDADEFKPARWANADQFHPAQFMPFGAGIRRCLGKEFALFEMKKVLCSLLERYKFGCHESGRGLNHFDAPMLVYLLHHSPCILTIKRL